MNRIEYKKITDYLNRCLERGRLSHAYIFYGPDENSKNETAFWFAGKLLKTECGKFHPDLFFAESEFDEEISINLVRQLKNFLTLRPCLGEHKIAIIKRAEKLNSYSQNALLKIFEEAPKHAVIILCAATLDSIPGTIASRAVKLPFWRFERELPSPNRHIFENLFESAPANAYNYLEKNNGHKAPEFFREWIIFLRTKLKENPTKEMAELLTKNQNVYFNLNETNLNPKFAYDELTLSLWKSRKN